MARHSKVGGADPLADLAKKIAILEREMAVQREAMERLRTLGETPRVDVSTEEIGRTDVAFNRF